MIVSENDMNVLWFQKNCHTTLISLNLLCKYLQYPNNPADKRLNNKDIQCSERKVSIKINLPYFSYHKYMKKPGD